MDALLPLILAAVVTMMLIPLLERRATALHVLDEPAPRKVHVRPIARVGGIAMAVGAALSMLLWMPFDREAVAIVLGGLVVLVFGYLDDRSNLAPATKLLGQLVGIAIAVFAGGVLIHSVTVVSHIELPGYVSLPLTLLFMVGVTNAINLADGLDGLAAGTTFLGMALILVLALASGMRVIAIVTVAFLGSLLGFLRFNSYPARVFMGDSGSQLLGYTLGVLSIVLTQDPRVPYSASLPLLLLGLPIIDTLFVIAVRLRRGRSPLAADRNHLHHRLLDLGFDHFEAVAIIYLLQAVILVLAWLMRFQSDINIILVFATCAAAVLMALFLAHRAGWSRHAVALPRLTTIVAERLPWLKAPARLPRWTNTTAWVATSLYCLGVSLTASAISMDVAWLALGLAGLLLIAVLRLVPERIIERAVHGAVFVAMVIAVYVDHIEPAKLRAFTLTKAVLFPVLAVAILLRLRLWRQRRFEITPLDVLVVIMALVLPNLPGLQGGPGNLGLSVAKLVLLLYAAEMLMRGSERRRKWLWASTALAIGMLALRGLAPLAT